MAIGSSKSTKQVEADDILKLIFFFFQRKIRFDISCELSARQTVHMKYQALFSLKKKKKNVKVLSTVLATISTLSVNHFNPCHAE